MRLVLLCLLLSACSALPRTHGVQPEEGTYIIKGPDGSRAPITLIEEDSLRIGAPGGQSLASYFAAGQGPWLLSRRSPAWGLFSAPFKVRPSRADVPLQANTNYNLSLYGGLQWDRFRYSEVGHRNGHHHPQRGAVGLGLFVGAGSVFMNPTFLSNRIDYEYDALALQAGGALLLGSGRIRTGLALGLDWVTDRYRRSWIYQGQPWAGLVVSASLE